MSGIKEFFGFGPETYLYEVYTDKGRMIEIETTNAKYAQNLASHHLCRGEKITRIKKR